MKIVLITFVLSGFGTGAPESVSVQHFDSVNACNNHVIAEAQANPKSRINFVDGKAVIKAGTRVAVCTEV